MSEDLLDEGINSAAESSNFSAKDKMAIRYVDLIASEPEALDDAFYADMRKHYSDEEIVELAIFSVYNTGYHTFFGSLKFYPLFSPDGRLVSQEESERLYGAAPASLHSAGAK